MFGASFSSEEIGAYYLVWPKVRGDYPPLLAFRDWLLVSLGEKGFEAEGLSL